MVFLFFCSHFHWRVTYRVNMLLKKHLNFFEHLIQPEKFYKLLKFQIGYSVITRKILTLETWQCNFTLKYSTILKYFQTIQKF